MFSSPGLHTTCNIPRRRYRLPPASSAASALDEGRHSHTHTHDPGHSRTCPAVPLRPLPVWMLTSVMRGDSSCDRPRMLETFRLCRGASWELQAKARDTFGPTGGLGLSPELSTGSGKPAEIRYEVKTYCQKIVFLDLHTWQCRAGNETPRADYTLANRLTHHKAHS